MTEKVLFTGKTHTTSGRDGFARSTDGSLDIKLSCLIRTQPRKSFSLPLGRPALSAQSSLPPPERKYRCRPIRRSMPRST